MTTPEAGDDKTQMRVPSQSSNKIPARLQASVAILEGHAEGMEYPITKTYAVIGRDKDSDVPVKDSLVSRQHAAILYQEGSFILKDLDSTNGTHMKGSAVKQANLRHGDKFRVGDSVLQFILEDTGSGKIYELKE